MKKAPRQRLAVNVEELDRIIDGALRAPVSASDGQKLTTALHAMAERRVRQRTTEKTSAVLRNCKIPRLERRRMGTVASLRSRKAMDVTVPLCSPARKKWRFAARHSSPGIPARNAAPGKYTAGKNRGRWCAWWGRRR